MLSETAPILLVFCTVPDTETAQRLARTLVEERLAACVNILPGVLSGYRWQGALQQDGELLLICKTTAATYAALEARLRELHPYELPECIAVEARAGLPAYLDWIRAQTREDTD